MASRDPSAPVRSSDGLPKYRPPVSSRRISRSTASSSSGRSGDECASARGTVTGRTLANSPSSLRSRNSACSGRIFGSTLSHLGPPHAPRKTASAAQAGRDVLVADRHAIGIDRRATDDPLVPLHPEVEGRSDRVDDAPPGADDVRSDAVARDGDHDAVRLASRARSHQVEAARRPWPDVHGRSPPKANERR